MFSNKDNFCGCYHETPDNFIFQFAFSNLLLNVFWEIQKELQKASFGELIELSELMKLVH